MSHHTHDADGSYFACSPAGRAWLLYTNDEDDHDLEGARKAVEAARAEDRHWKDRERLRAKHHFTEIRS